MKKFLFMFLFSAWFAKAHSQIAAKDSSLNKAVALNEKDVKTPVKLKKIILPTPEFINQPFYYDRNDNRLIRLESATAQMETEKKSLGLKGARQFLTMPASSSRARFIAKDNIAFIIKTSGDVIDLTSYIKLYQFLPNGEKRQTQISAKKGILNDNQEGKGKLISFSVRQLSKDNYSIQLPEALKAGEYGFVWTKNMELNDISVYAFGIDWKNSD